MKLKQTTVVNSITATLPPVLLKEVRSDKHAPAEASMTSSAYISTPTRIHPTHHVLFICSIYMCYFRAKFRFFLFWSVNWRH